MHPKLHPAVRSATWVAQNRGSNSTVTEGRCPWLLIVPPKPDDARHRLRCPRGLFMLGHVDVLDDLSVHQPNNPISVGCTHGVVSHHEDGHAQLLTATSEQSPDAMARGRIEVARRLVAQDDTRARDESTGDGDALHLAPRQLAGLVLSAVQQIDQREDALRPLPGACRGEAV